MAKLRSHKVNGKTDRTRVKREADPQRLTAKPLPQKLMAKPIPQEQEMQQQTTTRGFRLSPQQKRLWSLQHTTGLPDRSQCTVLIEGPLDKALLRTSLQKVIEKHE